MQRLGRGGRRWAHVLPVLKQTAAAADEKQPSSFQASKTCCSSAGGVLNSITSVTLPAGTRSSASTSAGLACTLATRRFLVHVCCGAVSHAWHTQGTGRMLPVLRKGQTASKGHRSAAASRRHACGLKVPATAGGKQEQHAHQAELIRELNCR